MRPHEHMAAVLDRVQQSLSPASLARAAGPPVPQKKPVTVEDVAAKQRKARAQYEKVCERIGRLAPHVEKAKRRYQRLVSRETLLIQKRETLEERVKKLGRKAEAMKGGASI